MGAGLFTVWKGRSWNSLRDVALMRLYFGMPLAHFILGDSGFADFMRDLHSDVTMQQDIGIPVHTGQLDCLHKSPQSAPINCRAYRVGEWGDNA
jgi:hypothetical protein